MHTLKLKKKWDEGKFVCIGLDKGDFEFDKSIIDATFDLVACYKPNSAFYEAEGIKGLESLKKTIEYIKQKDPQIAIILDAKRGDIENTNEAYVKAIFDGLGADAATVNPYLGKEALQPFLQREDKGIFVLVRTSNPGAGEFQDLEVYPEQSRRGKPLYQVVAEHVKDWGSNVGMVVGATYPEELKKVREIVGEVPILIPGVGAQGGDIKTTISAGKDSQGQGMIISSSRGIIFADNPREATQTLHQQIKEALNS
ncbi:orotidine-5'-phosphate decarboxylase [Candidatus Daviesbacteria bacterium]|nr:orotidine-5'-phosphate decarboxylase [Candidatus Daviesbacteria bacterium]